MRATREILEGADPPPAVRARAGAHRHDAAAASPVAAFGRPLPAVLGGLYAVSRAKLGNHQGGKDGRYREAKNRLALLNLVGPEFNKIHPIEIDDPEECYHLFRNHFLVPPGFDFANVPSYWGWWDAAAHADAYRMHKRQLQALQWLNPNQHWVLKCPNHLSGLQHLLETYPDARIVYTQRDPLEDGAVAVQPCGGDVVHDLRHGRSAQRRRVRARSGGALRRRRDARRCRRSARPDRACRVRRSRARSGGLAMSIYERLGYSTDAALKARMRSGSPTIRATSTASTTTR